MASKIFCTKIPGSSEGLLDGIIFAILLLQFMSAAKVSLKICRSDQGALQFQTVPLLSLAFGIKSKLPSVVLLELLIVSHLASPITSHTHPCPLQPPASPTL